MKMTNRIVFDGKIYYKKKDVAKLYEVSEYKLNKEIEKQNIETTTLKGFGRARWISEDELNKIVIENVTLHMQTKINDYQKTLHENLKMNALINVFGGFRESEIQLQEKAFKETREAFEEVEEQKQEQTITNEMINDMLAEEGYKERIVEASIKCDDKMFDLEFICNENEIVSGSHDYYMRKNLEGIPYLRQEIAEGKIMDFDSEDERVAIQFTKGVYKPMTVEAFAEAFKRLLKGEMFKESVDYTHFNDICLDDDMLLAMINSENISICNFTIPEQKEIETQVDIIDNVDIYEDMSNEDLLDEIIDIEYEIVEEEPQQVVDVVEENDFDMDDINKDLEELDLEEIVEEELQFPTTIGEDDEYSYEEDYEPLLFPSSGSIVVAKETKPKKKKKEKDDIDLIKELDLILV